MNKVSIKDQRPENDKLSPGQILQDSRDYNGLYIVADCCNGYNLVNLASGARYFTVNHNIKDLLRYVQQNSLIKITSGTVEIEIQ